MQTVPKHHLEKECEEYIRLLLIIIARRSENHQGKDTKEWSHLRHASAQAEALCSRMLESILALRLDKSCLGLIGDMMSSMKGRKLPTCPGEELIRTMTSMTHYDIYDPMSSMSCTSFRGSLESRRLVRI